ncbi:hypothetical protein QF029_005744, partial [Priestia megaterium]|nr:hypothetical protein [Priestia megaterium]
ERTLTEKQPRRPMPRLLFILLTKLITFMVIFLAFRLTFF